MYVGLEEGLLDIKLPEPPVVRSGDGQDNTYRDQLDNRRKDGLKIDAKLLAVTVSD